MHLVSFDDDIPEVFEKIKPGTSSDTMQPLAPGMQGVRSETFVKMGPFLVDVNWLVNGVIIGSIGP